MSKQNINNALKLYNANYYSEPVLDEKLLQFHNELDDYINKIKIATDDFPRAYKKLINEIPILKESGIVYSGLKSDK